jgi:hypothetical protein
MSTVATAPSAAPEAGPDDGSSARVNQVMIGLLGTCLAVSVAVIIAAGVLESVAVLICGLLVMAAAVGVMLVALDRLIGTAHHTYGDE